MTERTLPQIGRLFDLSGRVALVTGGSRGLGKAMARALAEAGADIVIASRNESELTAAAAEIVQGLGGQVRHLVADLGNRDQVEASRARSGASSCCWRATPAATSRAPSWSSTAASPARAGQGRSACRRPRCAPASRRCACGGPFGRGCRVLSGAGGRRASGRTAGGAGAAGPGHSHCRSVCAPPCGYGCVTARRCRTRCRAGGRTRRG